MKIEQLFEELDPIIKWKQNGDKSWTVRIQYGDDKVYVHTNKKRDALEKIVKERYGKKTFVK